MNIRSLLWGIAGSALLTGAAFAQTAPMMQGQGQWGPGAGNGMHYGMGYGPGAGMGPGMGCAGGQHIEGMLAFYKTELAITAAQESVWTPFADALRKQAQDMAGHPFMQGAGHRGMMGWIKGDSDAKAPALPDALDAHIAFAETHLADMKALSAAAKPLYKALSDDQKAKADDLFGGPGCRF